jgi:hypothetical protein
VANIEFADNSDNEDGFYVYVNGGRFNTLGRNVTAFSIAAACEPSDIYVTAYNVAGESAQSNTISVMDPEKCVPAAPSGLQVVSWDGGVAYMRFVDNSDNEDGFYVYVSGGRAKPLGPNSTTFWFEAGCAPWPVYVTAYNAAGESAASNTISISDPARCIPLPPSGLHVASWDDYGVAYMGFVDNSDNEDGFRIYVNGALFSILGRNVTTFSIDASCDPWPVHVAAYNAAGLSGPSNTITIHDESDCVEPPG